MARGAGPPGDRRRPTRSLARGEAAFIAQRLHRLSHHPRDARRPDAIGPDLTHVGSRLPDRRGTLPNEPDALVRWIGQTDRIKPGVHMPAFRALGADDLSALAAYLGSLQ